MADKIDHNSRKDMIFKLNVMGYAGCGKTAFCTRICNNSFPTIHTHTVKRDSYVTSIETRHIAKPTKTELNEGFLESGCSIDFLREAKMKKKNVPLWDKKSWGHNSTDTKACLRTLFGRNRKIINSYYVELADIPGTLSESLDLEEKKYTEELWNYSNCIYPLVTHRMERYDPPTADDLAEKKKLQHDAMQREQQYGVADDADQEALLPRNYSMLPEAQKQDNKANLNHLLRYARITMGFIIIFDITKRASWEKAKWLIASIQDNIFRGTSARPPIVVFGNKLDVLKRQEPGLIKRAFKGIKDKIECDDWKSSSFPPVSFFVGSVKDDYAIEVDLNIFDETKIPNLQELLELPRFTLEEVISATVTMRFDGNWISKEEPSAAKAGLVFQVYKHCENMNGMMGDEDDGKVKAVKAAQRGCCDSTTRGAMSICQMIACSPCTLGKRLVGLCTGGKTKTDE